jgi:hypothetical protein
VRGNDKPTIAMWGNLHLKSGLAAARAGDMTTADAHWTEANEAANRLGEDRDDYRLCFGPTNVNIWSVGLAVEALDGTEAVKRAKRFELPDHTQRERAGHHWIDVARGFLLHGDHDMATRSLFRAKEISPQQTRYHPMVHETIRTLARARGATDPVARLAHGQACTAHKPAVSPVGRKPVQVSARSLMDREPGGSIGDWRSGRNRAALLARRALR